MNCDCPSGVALSIRVVRVTEVSVPDGAVVTVTCTGRYWSSLLPPRLMTDTSTERGVRPPLTPVTTQAAWSTGFFDQTIRCRPATAEDKAWDRALMSRFWPWSWRSDGSGEGAEGILAGAVPGRVVGQAVVLVMKEELLDVVSAHGLTVGLDRPRGHEELPEAGHVEGEHTVHRLAGQFGPHGRGQRRGDIELRRPTEVAHVQRGVEPAPVPGEVTGDRDRTDRERPLTGGAQVTELHRAVGRGGHAHVQEGTRPRPHLGVVRGQHDVGLGPLEDGGYRRRHPGGLGQAQSGVVELVYELVVLGGQRADQSLGGSGVDGGQLVLRRGGDDRELPEGRHAARDRRCGAGRAPHGPGSGTMLPPPRPGRRLRSVPAPNGTGARSPARRSSA